MFSITFLKKISIIGIRKNHLKDSFFHFLPRFVSCQLKHDPSSYDVLYRASCLNLKYSTPQLYIRSRVSLTHFSCLFSGCLCLAHFFVAEPLHGACLEWS
jgi:hypothetical protein